MCWVYQPGEKSETYHRDDLRYEQSVHAGGRRGCECTRFSLSMDSCTDKIALTDSASPPVYALICGKYIYFQRQSFELYLYAVAKCFHHKREHISSTGGLSFAPAGQLKSLANSTRLLTGRLTRHGEGLCPFRLCRICCILVFQVLLSYHSRLEKLLICCFVFKSTPIHGKCKLKLYFDIITSEIHFSPKTVGWQRMAGLEDSSPSLSL